jgi:hypothetical protein
MVEVDPGELRPSTARTAAPTVCAPFSSGPAPALASMVDLASSMSSRSWSVNSRAESGSVTFHIGSESSALSSPVFWARERDRSGWIPTDKNVVQSTHNTIPIIATPRVGSRVDFMNRYERLTVSTFLLVHAGPKIYAGCVSDGDGVGRTSGPLNALARSQLQPIRTPHVAARKKRTRPPIRIDVSLPQVRTKATDVAFRTQRVPVLWASG